MNFLSSREQREAKALRGLELKGKRTGNRRMFLYAVAAAIALGLGIEFVGLV